GRDVVLCRTAEELDRAIGAMVKRPWFHGHGVLAQELVEPLGWDLRVVVAGGRVVGAARRVAARGEWRTNVALGGVSRPAVPPPPARRRAPAAPRAFRGALAGIALLPPRPASAASGVTGPVDFRPCTASARAAGYLEP